MEQLDHVSGLDPEAHSRAGWPAKPIRRRNRMINRDKARLPGICFHNQPGNRCFVSRAPFILSCLECRKRKLKCSKTSPSCTNCVKTGRDCLYIGPRLDEASQMRLAEIKEKQGTLERELERDVAKSIPSKSTLQQRIIADDIADEYDEGRDLEASPFAALDLTYEDDVDDAGDMIDLGIQIGKMRITERIGGLSRPRISEEISAGLAATQPPGLQPLRPPPPPPPTSQGSGIDELPDFLKPGDQYIVPTSGFFFGQIGEPPSILQFLPYKNAADRFMKQYFISVHPIATCTHRPTLEAMYATFWEEINAGYEPRPSMQAVIFAAMFSGAISMDDNVMLAELDGYSKADWVASLRLGTETALSKANFLRTTKVETIQAFIMYMLPLCRAEVSRAHSVLVGTAVRMAECMGLHRDGEEYGLTPLETHVRRLIWHQLCFLDIRTCEAQGPKPVIRLDDYTTKLPVNCNEEELTHAIAPPESADVWTTNTLSQIRFEINEMMRIIWIDRRKLETRRITLTAVLTKIENFRRKMSQKYDRLLDTSHPIQRYAKCVMYLLTYRLHVMTLHPYHTNAAIPMPPRLNQLLISSSIMIVELGMQLETNPNFQDWAWYLGAYFQYQVALLLATEVYFRPQSRDAKRIWSCLDYVFSMDRRLPPEAKALQLLSEVQSKTETYMRMRKMRGPTSVLRAVPGRDAVTGAGNPSTIGGQPQQHPHGMSYNMPKVESDYPSSRVPGPSAMPHDVPKLEPNYSPPRAAGPPAPQPQMVFAGVSDGQALWSLPPSQSSPESDTSTSSMGGQVPVPGLRAGMGEPQGNIMDTLDWDAINSLFPNDPQTGGLIIQGFHDPNFGVASWAA